MKWTLLAIMLSMLTSVGAQPPLEAKMYQGLLYRQYVPSELRDGQKVPLILFLHGAGERGDDNQAQLIYGVNPIIDYSLRTRQPVILIAPQCPEEIWWAARDGGVGRPLHLALELVEQSLNTLPIDKDRVYITGLSMGGYGTWSAITAQPKLFAAAIPICGGGRPQEAPKIAEVPLWVFHGAADSVVPVVRSQEMVTALLAAGGWPRYTEYPGVDHDSWTQTYNNDEVLEWFLAQRLSQREHWQSLFNGQDLDDWIPKFTGYDLGENVMNTFRAEDGLLKVSYDQYETFGGRFGYLFYREPFSHYLLRVDYRFVGQQVEGGANWALRNNGVMIHSQSPETMGKDQKFPVSIEVQMLGGDGTHPRPTGNVCTPGTHVMMNGQLVTQHCTDSSSATYPGDQWVHLEVEVHGHGKIRHVVNGRVVMEYEQPQYDPSDSDAQALIKGDDLNMSSGWIALQAESHPTEFRCVELLPLEK